MHSGESCAHHYVPTNIAAKHGLDSRCLAYEGVYVNSLKCMDDELPCLEDSVHPDIRIDDYEKASDCW